MRFPNLIKANFSKRINRFVCQVLLDGKETYAYLRNTGRLRELLVEEANIYLRKKEGGKYPYEILLVESSDGFLVCLDSQLAPKIYAEGKEATYEPKVGESRFDLLIGKRLIEVKSVNLVKNGIAMFPDAPTKRGAKHLESLLKVYPQYEPEVVFVVQRGDAYAFKPKEDTDPIFAKRLRDFAKAGHKVSAWRCFVSLEEIKLKDEIEVIL